MEAAVHVLTLWLHDLILQAACMILNDLITNCFYKLIQ